MSVAASLRALSPRLRQIVIVAALFGLLAMSVLGLSLAAIKSGGSGSQGDGEAGRQFFYVGAFILILAASRPLAKPQKLLALPVALVIALVWCGLSVTWSAVPGIALRRFLLTTMIIIALFRMIEHLGFDTTLKVARTLLVIVLIMNFLAIVTLPFAIHRAAEVGDVGDPNLVGSWRGVLPQKNFAGAVCAITIIMFALDPQRIRSMVRIGVIAAAAFFLVMTKSKTSIGLVMIALAAGFLFRRYSPSYRMLMVPLGILIVPLIGFYGSAQFAILTTPTDDQTKLTGRVGIWPPLAAFSRDHPLHGAGFGSFWNIGDQSPIYAYGRGWVTKLGNGHNGYLDLLTQVGIPGLALVVFAVFVVPLLQLFANYAAPRAQAALLVAMLLFCALHNFTETSLFDRDQIVQVFWMLTIALIAKITTPATASRVTRRPPSLEHRGSLSARGRSR